MLASGVLSVCALGQNAAEDAGTGGGARDELPDQLASPDERPGDGPDIFLLPDKNGRLRRVLGYRYEDFLEAWQAQGAGDESRQPKFAIADFKIEAREREKTVAATIAIDVELHDEGWVDVPIALASLIVENCQIDDEASRGFVSFDANRSSYVAWFKGAPGQRRTVRLKGQFPTERDGDGRRLAVALPMARSSAVDLQTGYPVTVTTPSSAVVTHHEQDGRSSTHIEGVRDSLVVAWGGAAANQGKTSPGVEAVVDSIVSIEPSRLAYASSIKLTSLGEAVDRIRIKLPIGSTAATAPDGTGYKVSPISTDGIGNSAEVDVVFDAPTPSPPVVRLNSTQPAAAGGSVLRIGALEVVGAFRHAGHVAVRVSDQLHVHFERDGQVQQVAPADLPPPMLEQSLLAAFETSGTTWAIEAHTQPRQRKVTVTPDYQLHLGSQGAALEAELNYQITGGPAFELRIDLRGWELTEQTIESGGAIDLAEQHVTPDQVLILPLHDADVQEVRLRFALRREAGLGVHDLPLPEVQEAYALPGELRVTCDEAWQASALIEKSVGVSPVDLRLESAPAPPSNAPSPRQPGPIRFQTFLPQARLAVDVSQRSRLIEVESTITARVEGATLSAEQVLHYEIRYQPAEQIEAIVSADLLANEGLEVLLDGKALPSSAVDVHPLTSETADGSEDNLRLVITFPSAKIGKAHLSLRTLHALTADQQTGKAAIQLPLALPDQPATTTANISSSRSDVRVALAADALAAWRPSADVRAATSEEALAVATLAVETARPARELALRLEPASAGSPIETRIEAAWVQTWIAGGMRQDRIVYRFHTSGERVTVALAEGFELVEVLLDGKVTSPDRTRSGSMALELTDRDAGATHTLELRRHTTLHLNSWGKQRVAFPQIVGADAWSPFFWQLILPPDLAALATPAGMSAEYRLGWHGIRWGREPTQSQRDLERWTAATTAPTPGPRTNQYLYSAFEPPDSVEFVALRRIWIVVAAGLAVLAIGLAWLYTSLARSAAFWLLLCVAAGVLLLVYPEAVIVLVQAVILGGAFTVLSAVTQWLLASSSPRRSSSSTSASSVGSLAATQPWMTEPPVASGASSASGTTYQPSGSAP
jgi:hypothetical protein